MKINAYSFSCCDVRKCTVLRHIILPATASYIRYKKAGMKGVEQAKEIYVILRKCRKKRKEKIDKRQGGP